MTAGELEAEFNHEHCTCQACGWIFCTVRANKTGFQLGDISIQLLGDVCEWMLKWKMDAYANERCSAGVICASIV
jgi:hypothetical protein